MAAQNEVDLGHGLRERPVAGTRRIGVDIPQVRQADHQRTPLFAQFTAGGARRRERVRVTHALVQAGEHELLERDAQPENSHLDAVELAHRVWLHMTGQRRLAHVVVGRHELEPGLRQHRHKPVHTVVEVVVAQGRDVVAHGGHRAKLDLAAEKVEVRRTLKNVPRIEEEDVLVRLAHPPDQRRAPGRTSQSGEASAVHREGIHAGVCVVGMQDDQAELVVDQGAEPVRRGAAAEGTTRRSRRRQPRSATRSRGRASPCPDAEARDRADTRGCPDAERPHEIATFHRLLPSLVPPPARRTRPSSVGDTVSRSRR